MTAGGLQLLVDAQAVQGEGRRRGIGRYASELLAAIAKARPNWRIQAAVSTHLGAVDFPAGIEVVSYSPPVPLEFCDGPTTDVLRLHFADWLKSHAPDAVLILSAFEGGGIPVRFPVGGPPCLAVLYDLIPLLFAAEYLHRQPLPWRYYARQLRQAMTHAGLLAISEVTRHDVTELLGTSAVNIRGAVATDFPLTDPDTARSIVAELFQRGNLSVPSEFLLYVGGGDFRKNLRTLLAAFARLPAATRRWHKLVIAGELPGHFRMPLEQQAAELGVASELILTGYVTDRELVALYQAARVFVFPSLYEGLGLPVLEAAACGTEVVSSGTSSIPEFAAPGTRFVDPHDAPAMAHAIYATLAKPRSDDMSVKQEFAASFTWSASAETTCQQIESAVRSTPAELPPGEIVWWRSFSPTLTAADVTLFTGILNGGRLTLLKLAGDPPPPAVVAARARVRTPSELAKRSETLPPAAWVYEVGSAAELWHILPELMRRPGLLILPPELADAEIWSDPRLAKARALCLILVRGADEVQFPAVLARVQEETAHPDRRWRDAVLDALMQAPEAGHVLPGWAAWCAATSLPVRSTRMAMS